MIADFERVSSDDLMSLATDRGATPMQVGAVLMLDTRSGCDPAALIAAIARQLPGVPRLRQRLVRPRIPLGRPLWIDDPRFRIEQHISIADHSQPESMDGLLRIASELVTTRLPLDRPLWAAVIAPNMDDGSTGLAIVFHHVVADGIAGLAILSALADGGADAPEYAFPRQAPSRALLGLDAARTALISVRRLPRAIIRLGHALTQVGPSLRTPASGCSLNQPVGRMQRIVTVRADLAAIRDVAHSNHGTVNDVVLSAITGALRHLLKERGELLDEFVISVPFSARRSAVAGSFGNQSGAVPMRLPATGAAAERLRAIADITRVKKLSMRGASTAILGPIFRGLGAVGLYQWFIDHQRVVHSFVTNVKGPPSPVSLGGFEINDIVPLAVAMGNITISFAVLSYAGRLTITIVSDATLCPDLYVLQDALANELVALTC